MCREVCRGVGEVVGKCIGGGMGKCVRMWGKCVKE